MYLHLWFKFLISPRAEDRRLIKYGNEKGHYNKGKYFCLVGLTTRLRGAGPLTFLKGVTYPTKISTPLLQQGEAEFAFSRTYYCCEAINENYC